MTTNILKLPFNRLVCRGFATQATSPQLETLDAPPINGSTLPNKILVSSQDLNGGLSRISIAFRTGPRNELPKNAGACHIIRSMTGFSTHHFTDFFILRNLQQLGAYLTCTGDREITSFNVIGTRDKMSEIAGFMASVVSAPAFKPWQITRNFPRIKYELSTLNPQTHTMELLHKAAFRDGLGNSLFISEDQLSLHNNEVLRDFYTAGFTANRAAVVGFNLAHKDVVKFAECFTLPDGDPPAGNSKYYGGEMRVDKTSYFASVAIATQGASLKDLKESLTYGILQHAIGVSPCITWGGSPAPLIRDVSAISESAAAKCFNICYSDNGLFGVILTMPALNAGSVVEAAWKVLRSGQVSDADIKRGKALLKSNLLHSCSKTENVVDDMAAQSLISGAVVPGPVLAEAIDKITNADVQNAAKKISNGKFTMVGYGNLSDVPYLDCLK